MLGLEYTGAELVANLRSALSAAIVDFALNFTPGLLTGLLLKWNPLAAVLLGGVTYVSSGFAVTRAPPRIGTANCDDYRVGFSGLLWAMSHLVCKET